MKLSCYIFPLSRKHRFNHQSQIGSDFGRTQLEVNWSLLNETCTYVDFGPYMIENSIENQDP